MNSETILSSISYYPKTFSFETFIDVDGAEICTHILVQLRVKIGADHPAYTDLYNLTSEFITAKNSIISKEADLSIFRNTLAHLNEEYPRAITRKNKHVKKIKMSRKRYYSSLLEITENVVFDRYVEIEKQFKTEFAPKYKRILEIIDENSN